MAVLEHICEVRGVAADFAGTILAVGAQCVQDTTGMLSKHERYYGLGMDALVVACSRNTNVIMVWAWMLW